MRPQMIEHLPATSQGQTLRLLRVNLLAEGDDPAKELPEILAIPKDHALHAVITKAPNPPDRPTEILRVVSSESQPN